VRDDDCSREYIEMLRKLTPEQKLDAAARMYWRARDAEAARLRSQNPEWTEEEVQREVRRIFLYGSVKPEEPEKFWERERLAGRRP
jgi:hypothetical protein